MFFLLGFVLGGLAGGVAMAAALAARVASDQERAYWDGYRHGTAGASFASDIGARRTRAADQQPAI